MFLLSWCYGIVMSGSLCDVVYILSFGIASMIFWFQGLIRDVYLECATIAAE